MLFQENVSVDKAILSSHCLIIIIIEKKKGLYVSTTDFSNLCLQVIGLRMYFPGEQRCRRGLHVNKRGDLDNNGVYF